MNALLQLIWILALGLMAKRIFRRITSVRVSPLEDNECKDRKIEKDKDLVKALRTHKESAIELVEDEYCKVYISKDKAYSAIDSHGKIHYFCSWECREKYLLEHRSLRAS